ncbi:protein NRT1/ PTR FAMILY 1.2-like isoform X2 [Vigna angularis]|uniref:protein NRT1/ PTR FAMILY 1.2 isoform X2 n=1 Tax=Phaseolus angularis TaxID=3914 RepID=UPI0022B436D8|nr:protein NRT1/ PTR FAMILY 1.2 isoform X2 [Vigna angularis]XP_052737003.1 protein NRT1/ PTR FAMILY 1.2-like isoform X2 [Vigna angularis]
MEASGAAEQKLLENVTSSQSSSSSSSLTRKGGLRTMPFIIVNECLERVASYGIMPNMILYLLNGYGMPVAKGTSVIYTWSATSDILSIFGAFISDSYLGRFLVISIGSFSSLLGLIILWLTAMIPELKPSCESIMLHCSSATTAQLAVLFLSLGLISIGAGCVRPCSIAFGADQLKIKEGSNNERLLDSYFNCFILGSPIYAKVKPGHSLLTSFVQVAVVSVKNRKLSLPYGNFDQYYQDRDSELAVPTDSLRCLNKACMIKTPETLSNPDGSVSDPWSQCTVGQVESLKSVLRVLPMWSTGILMMVSQSSFSTLQATTLDRRLVGNFKMPAGSFSLIMVITLSIVIPIYDRIMVPLLAKHWGMPRGFSCKTRIGIGLLFVCAGKATSALVETMRRTAAIEQGFEDQPNAVIDMSVLWLVPEFVLLGIGEAFNPVGQVEFFYTGFPKTMSSFAMALFTLELAAANVVGSVLVSIVDKVTSLGGKESWLSTNINSGHLNYYYALLTFLGVINYFYFLAICWAYGPAPWQKLEASADKEEEQFENREVPTS